MKGTKETYHKGSINPISIRETEKILEQMKTCVCEIHTREKKGTGFFIKIPYGNQLLTVLMTNNHVLGENEISDGKTITLTLNNGQISKNIKMDFKRKRYTNEILDVTIIELMEKDSIFHYLELEQNILDEIYLKQDYDDRSVMNNRYKNESIYILNYIINRGEEICTSYGVIENIESNEILHKCNTEGGSSGSPILLLRTKKSYRNTLFRRRKI